MNTAEKIVAMLNLQPHPSEGGYFSETYKAAGIIPKESLHDNYGGDRSFCTAIYYLLTPDTFSAMHRVRSDEIFHFYLGDPVEMLQLFPDGTGKTVIIGNDIEKGMLPQVIVPAGVWQGSRLADGGEYALMGTTVSPGFEYEDYEDGEKDFLIKSYPEFEDMITSLTSNEK
ncbi:MAG: cupin domain-containing protein [Dehalococcoidales bacterium]|nr:cupin domain-containing protein [Dehalococcoidales bacterium]